MRFPKITRFKLPAVLALLFLVLTACDEVAFPRDPDGTLDRVEATGRVRVAAVDHRPWVIWNGRRSPGGAEVRLAEAFARELGATVEWRRASAFDALEALKRGDVDLAVGGFTREEITLHGGAASTYGYFTEALVVAARPGGPIPAELDGEEVVSPLDRMTDSLIEDVGGVPIAGEAAAASLVALPDWEIPAHELVPTGIELHRSEHVMAVPRGENAWVDRLERFLRRNGHRLGELLREEGS